MFTLDEQEEVPQPHTVTGLSKDERIKEFLRLDAQIKELSYERRGHASALIEIAAEERDGQKTVHMQSSNGSKVAVEFKTDWVCDSQELETVKELLKDEKFNEIFKTEYTPRVRPLRTFLNTVFSDERWEIAKGLIRECCKEVEKQPYVAIEKAK